MVRPDQPLRVVRAGLLGELVGVDRVAAVRGQRDALAGLGVVAAGLGELPGHPAHLDHGQAAAVHEHDRHLEDGLHAAADGVGGRVGEGLGAVAALEQERLAPGGGGEPVAQVVALAGEHERRVGAQLRGRGGQGVGAVPGRLLRRHEVGPGQGHAAQGRPGGGCYRAGSGCWSAGPSGPVRGVVGRGGRATAAAAARRPRRRRRPPRRRRSAIGGLGHRRPRPPSGVGPSASAGRPAGRRRRRRRGRRCSPPATGRRRTAARTAARCRGR